MHTAQWGLDCLAESTELMVGEVVADAVRSASRPIALRLLRVDVLRREVGDDSPPVPRMRHAQLSDEGGRGLFLVDQLARHWGATRVSTGKAIWFEQRRSQARLTNTRASPSGFAHFALISRGCKESVDHGSHRLHLFTPPEMTCTSFARPPSWSPPSEASAS
jgi:hypothetical protein